MPRELDGRKEPLAKRRKSRENPFSMDFSLDESSCTFPNSFTSGMQFSESGPSVDQAEQLKEFQVLDEVGEDDLADEGSDSGDSNEAEEDITEDEIERMLDEDLPDKFKEPPKEKEKPYYTKHKVILEEKGTNHFEVLPLDWLVVMHNSGIPVYLHKSSRVCTLSKPYFLGKGSVRKHELPVSAIPCLAYRRALEEEEKQKGINKKVDEEIKRMSNGGQSTLVESSLANASNKISETSQNNEEQRNTISSVASCPFTRESNTDIKITSDIDVEKQDGQGKLGTAVNQLDSTSDILLINENESLKSNDTNDEAQDVSGNDDYVFKRPFPPGCTSHNKPPNDSNQDAGPSLFNDTEIPAHMKPVVLPGGLVLPAAKIETMQENWKSQHLTHEEVTDYCKKLFKFKNISVIHFKYWSDRRRYTKAKKAMQRPTLPEGTKLISIPARPANDDEVAVQGVLGRPKRAQREWIMNMNGRSYVSVFHEYVRRALQKEPVYEFRQLENPKTPYEATVLIDNMKYGVGLGGSKRQAKSNAARDSILILIPEMKEQINKEEQSTRITSDEPDLAFFDMVGIEDPRIMGFCTTTMEPSPHALLRTCLLRNFGTGDRQILCDEGKIVSSAKIFIEKLDTVLSGMLLFFASDFSPKNLKGDSLAAVAIDLPATVSPGSFEMKKLKYEKIEFSMTVGKHRATVICKNKKMGKQRASQAILQLLHPHVKSWGSLLRLYGSRSIKSCRDRKLEEQEITLLQDKAQYHQPNHAILKKLCIEMERLNSRDSTVVSLGTLVVKDTLPNLSGSSLNNVEL